VVPFVKLSRLGIVQEAIYLPPCPNIIMGSGRVSATEMRKARRDFFHIYTNLPLHIRTQVVVTIDYEPITWHFIYKILLTGNKKADEILIILKKLDII
jgi:hypothetical protein